ncbi:MAG: autotransporter outer membrane beta-barrel domain-containing protein, partial [Hyphomicrobiales bacterium]|nr:autotransporter outer membrane beta-barrel domain-containing protein [Hyphomicrobiales bacterium]
SASEEAIEIEHSGTGNVDITTSDTVTATDNNKDAIFVNHSGSGNITLAVNGSVVGGSSANAIDLSTASGDATIILGTGASFTRGIDVSGVTGSASIEIGGTGNRSFDVGDLPTITGDRNFNKNGGHTLTVTGTHTSGAAFEQTNINEGKLVWGGTDFRTTSLAIAHGATLEITDNSSLAGTSVTLSGRLELTGNSSSIVVESLAGGNDSDIDIDVDFSGGDASLANARLTATSATGTTPVNIRAIMGGFPEIAEDDEDGFITLENFLSLTTRNANAFTAGDVLDNGNFDFDIVYDSDNDSWNLVACPVDAGCRVTSGGIEEVFYGSLPAAYESLPATLTQLAGLESRQQRLRGRQHAVNQAMWARVAGTSGEFEPLSTTQATYESENALAEFGIEVPIHTNDSSFTLGASMAFGDATTEISVPGSVGEIASKPIISTVNAGWERKGIYVDGQLRYTSFDNTIETDAKIADVDAESYNAGIEVGYAMETGKLIGIRPDAILIPSAQLLWTSVDFDDFTDANGTNVTLEDGDVLLARAGVAFEDAWEAVAFRGHADVLVPLDGEVVTKLDGMETISEREDPAFDVGIGATYSWGGAYALSADISTQQGGDVAGYAASLGFVYSFF